MSLNFFYQRAPFLTYLNSTVASELKLNIVISDIHSLSPDPSSILDKFSLNLFLNSEKFCDIFCCKNVDSIALNRKTYLNLNLCSDQSPISMVDFYSV